MSLPGEYNGLSPTSISHGKLDTFVPLWWDQAPPLSYIHMLLEFIMQEFLRLCNQKIIWIGLLLYMGSRLLPWNIEHFLRLENFPVPCNKISFSRDEKDIFLTDCHLYLQNHNIKPEAEYISDPQNSNG